VTYRVNEKRFCAADEGEQLSPTPFLTVVAKFSHVWQGWHPPSSAFGEPVFFSAA
jgi:hypothetical protein